jgi:hypothetical protein
MSSPVVPSPRPWGLYMTALFDCALNWLGGKYLTSHTTTRGSRLWWRHHQIGHEPGTYWKVDCTLTADTPCPSVVVPSFSRSCCHLSVGLWAIRAVIYQSQKRRLDIIDWRTPHSTSRWTCGVICQWPQELLVLSSISGRIKYLCQAYQMWKPPWSHYNGG